MSCCKVERNNGESVLSGQLPNNREYSHGSTRSARRSGTVPIVRPDCRRSIPARYRQTRAPASSQACTGDRCCLGELADHLTVSPLHGRRMQTCRALSPRRILAKGASASACSPWTNIVFGGKRNPRRQSSGFAQMLFQRKVVCEVRLLGAIGQSRRTLHTCSSRLDTRVYFHLKMMLTGTGLHKHNGQRDPWSCDDRVKSI